MEIPRFVIQIVVAIVCACIASALVPRRIPGGLLGLVLIGLAGTWLGGWVAFLFYREFRISHAVLRWQFQGVEIVPAVVGCTIVLYLATFFAQRGRYEN